MSAARVGPQEAFPWRRMMELGLGVLRLSPAEFWRSSPREIAAAFGGSPTPLLRQTLDDLERSFPD